ncbi:BREX-5 system adenine-specific DNA-methyltransferase PglX [Halorussus lipolyticus]|uniref:BREX-5 system adenine-specific DNA-methyltransferase PglX n=1 Tax=Halorussus lipolyticus TaxID=3034024 RepID=UPI0023E87130|nr:BREX-5 system adenine-specific DNA-methyltransferase PglX [Halorussus sp. DT80]
MAGDSLSRRKAQLDTPERDHLESVVAEMRERVEDNLALRLSQMGLDTEPDDDAGLDDEARQVAEAIALEAGDDGDWDAVVSEYVTGVGYTVVNRLSALRCMEVRGFLDEEVTAFNDDGLTPSAETLVRDESLPADEAVLTAYRDACDELTEEIELLFDRSSADSQIEPDADAFEDLCALLDEVPDEVWRADDVLGWVYEYYNVSQLPEVRERMRTGRFDADDVAVANQFYTPHWVARLLTDNAVAKPHLLASGERDACIEAQRGLSPDERIERDPGYDAAPEIEDLCTYLVAAESDDAGNVVPDRHPSKIRVLDPACGTGHFLLYAFDVLERIWRDATDVDPAEIPARILKHNLHGIDIDMQACRLSAFNLYLKARSRAETEGGDDFEMPTLGVVCADSERSDTTRARGVIETLAETSDEFAGALETVLEDFRETDGLGGLLDVTGTLADALDRATHSEEAGDTSSLSAWIDRLHDEIEREAGDRFCHQNLRSFLRVVRLLTDEYDAVVMNPPYGGHRRMPKGVKEYVGDHYEFKPEYYANFLEQSGRLLKPQGRIGMLVPRSFMYKESFEDVRRELVEPDGKFDFDFLVEFGDGVLDNATVRTVGTVLTKGETENSRGGDDHQSVGEFVQLSDVRADEQEETFARVLGDDPEVAWRRHSVPTDEFRTVPGGMLTYWTPSDLRELYASETVLDAEQAGLDRDGIGSAKKGIDTGDNDRFVRRSWECDDESRWRPYAKGGERSWFHYPDDFRVLWGTGEDAGREISRHDSSTIRNRDAQGREAVTWPLIKDSGHRFARFPSGGVSDNGGPCFYPDDESTAYLTALLNSTIYTGLMLAQTPERQWNLSDVAVLPYFDAPDEARRKLTEASAELTELVERFESRRLRSGRYGETLGEYEDVAEFVAERANAIEEIVGRMRERKAEIDAIVARELAIGDDVLAEIEREAALRYGGFDPVPYDTSDLPTDEEAVCRRLVSHLVLRAVRESDDGIVDLSADFRPGEDLHDAIADELHDLFDAPPEAVLADIDRTLGAQSAESSAYPNVERWVREEFFDAHLSQFENTPVIWRLTTARLVSDPAGEGFGCLVDYAEIDSSLFDRLETQYLEPRKADLRERRNAAERRRADDSLSASERADAADEYDRCVSGLEQIEAFEEAMRALSDESPREWGPDDRERAEALGRDVAEFRERTDEKLDGLDKLADLHDEAWFADVFSPAFREKVAANRGEWISALEDLQAACSAYARPAEKPVEAHHYDLLAHFPDLAGSDHYSSNGVLFTTYYFEREEIRHLDEEQPEGSPGESTENPSESTANPSDETAEILADLTADVDEYKSLAEEIEDQCADLKRSLSSDWKTRALAEITTAGYRPERKHGVAVTLEPLADAKLVPESVERRVL